MEEGVYRWHMDNLIKLSNSKPWFDCLQHYEIHLLFGILYHVGHGAMVVLISCDRE